MSVHHWGQVDASGQEPLPHVTEPRQARALGDAAGAPVGVYLATEAAHFIDAFIQANPQRTMGGILVGYPASGDKRPLLFITGAIETKESFDPDETLQFSEVSRAYINEVWHREYPGTVLIGWFRSNPAQGVELSVFDRFSHHRLFAKPWQIAFVIDPSSFESTFYYTTHDGLARLDNFYLWNPASNPRLVAALRAHFVKTFPDEERLPIRRDRSGLSFGAALRRRSLWLILGIMVCLGFAFPWMVERLPGTGREIATTRDHLMAVQALVEQAESAQAHLNATVSTPTPTQSLGSTLPPEPTEQSNDSQAALLTQGALDGRQPADSYPLTHQALQYTVAEGDTLWSISERMLGDPLAFQALAQTNGIANPDVIYPGMALRVLTESGDINYGDAQATSSDSMRPVLGSGQ